ncbi:MaoC family dehydratase [uncultured Flavonifractor sp.]|uniref:MaoC family dehydratase n=1 Tax=uncultured Flavonifractor sp. TaxID=1193534 RepID=UPI0026255365|nr:MaoC family dehydratase [uncultured Flavonifractor sp.]
MSSRYFVGQKASVSRTISESDVYLFAGVTGDLNPAHTNEEYAKTTHFKTRIAHGMLSAGLISAVLGMHLPGPGTIYTGQTLKFLAPVHIGDTITATAEIKSLDLERNRVVLTTTCANQEGTVVLTGEATALLPRDRA